MMNFLIASGIWLVADLRSGKTLKVTNSYLLTWGDGGAIFFGEKLPKAIMSDSYDKAGKELFLKTRSWWAPFVFGYLFSLVLKCVTFTLQNVNFGGNCQNLDLILMLPSMPADNF